MSSVCYGPFFDCGPCGGCGGCGGCNSGCNNCDAGVATPPAPEKFDPTPAAE
jgi:hypothetical protein